MLLTNMCMIYDERGNVLVQDVNQFHYIRKIGEWSYELK